MASPLKRGQSGNQVTNQFPSTAKHTPSDVVSTFVPHGLRLQQTIQSSGSVTIPAGVNWVYVVLTGAGGNGNGGSGGGAGGVAWGWTLAQNTCVIGTSSALANGYTRYGHIIAGNGGEANINNSYLGSGGRPDRAVGSTNYYGIPGGLTAGEPGSGAAGGNNVTKGGDGISGGGGPANSTGNGFAGGSGLVGGGGGIGSSGNSGASGGSGIGVNGTIYTGGTNNGRNAGGGAGIAANGSNATASAGGAGGLGGGGGGGGVTTSGSGGNGILYIFY